MSRIAARLPRQRPAQRGQVALGVLAILGIGFGAALYVFISPANSTIQRNKITAAILVQAKDALIGYATSDNNRPGSLPCPDLLTNNPAFNNVPNDGSADQFSGLDCPSYVGRLPWKTLGLPDLRDSDGERLWYAVSREFARNPSCGASCPLNSDISGELTILGTAPASNVVAIVFSAGPVVGSQARDGPPNQNNAANYLECSNEDNDTVYASSAANCSFNDKLLPITGEALMSVVEMRVLRTMRAALAAYAATPGNGYPFANPYSDNTNYECAYLQIEGRFPVKIKTPPSSGCLLYADWGPELPAWFGSNRWQTVSYYSVDPCKVGSVAAAGGAIVSGLNTLCALGIPPRVDGAAKDAVVLVGSSALAAVAGQIPRPCGARSACLENPNLSGNAFVTPTRSSTNNDRLVSVP